MLLSFIFPICNNNFRSITYYIRSVHSKRILAYQKSLRQFRKRRRSYDKFSFTAVYLFNIKNESINFLRLSPVSPYQRLIVLMRQRIDMFLSMALLYLPPPSTPNSQHPRLSPPTAGNAPMARQWKAAHICRYWETMN